MTGTGLLPAEACDTHMHFYHAGVRASATAVLTPPPAHRTDYQRLQSRLGCRRVVVVQPSTYGLDNTLQLDMMRSLGDQARGVMVVDASVTDATLQFMTALGVRGARFFMLPGGAVGWDDLPIVAGLIAPHDWHIQLQLNGRELADRLDQLMALPVPLVIDHVGRYMPPVGLDDPGYAALVALVAAGNCWVKLSAPYESSVTGPPRYEDVTVLVRDLVARAPDRMLWATNWPHPGRADPPAPSDLLRLVDEWLPDREVRHRVLVANPAALYGFADG